MADRINLYVSLTHFGSDRFPDWQTTLDFLQNEV